MREFSFRLQVGFFVVFAATFLAALCPVSAAGRAQTPSTAGSARSPQDQAADDALLNKARTLYYSSAKAGLAGFDCTVHPDWLATFVSANPGTTISNDDPRLLLLNRVGIVLHANLKTDSAILDWNAPSGALSSDQTTLLNQMHSASQQTLGGFVQFWTPFIDGSVIPDNSSGLEVTHTATGITFHAESNGTTVTEVFSNDLLLEHYDVVMSGTSIKFEPSYKATPQGLLVEHFVANIQAVGDPPAPVQKMIVGVQYQTVGGFPIPSQLNMEVVGTGVMNLALSQCTVQR
jgi:hypothetical protein